MRTQSPFPNSKWFSFQIPLLTSTVPLPKLVQSFHTHPKFTWLHHYPSKHCRLPTAQSIMPALDVLWFPSALGGVRGQEVDYYLSRRDQLAAWSESKAGLMMRKQEGGEALQQGFPCLWAPHPTRQSPTSPVSSRFKSTNTFSWSGIGCWNPREDADQAAFSTGNKCFSHPALCTESLTLEMAARKCLIILQFPTNQMSRQEWSLPPFLFANLPWQVVSYWQYH